MKEKTEDLGNGITFRDNFDPGPIRKRLGLEGGPAEKMPLFEKKRQAEMLLRANALSKADLIKLNAWVRLPSPQVSRERGSNKPDELPFATNKHLRR